MPPWGWAVAAIGVVAATAYLARKNSSGQVVYVPADGDDTKSEETASATPVVAAVDNA